MLEIHSIFTLDCYVHTRTYAQIEVEAYSY